MKNIKKLMMLLGVVFMASCSKPDLYVSPEYLEVNVSNIAGAWELVEWNGAQLADGTYFYIDFVRKDKTYTMYQNMDSFSDAGRVVTGNFNISTDDAAGAVIRGNYDHDSGDWSHRYIVTELTAVSMTWTALDDRTFVQTFRRVDVIPVK